MIRSSGGHREPLAADGCVCRHRREVRHLLRLAGGSHPLGDVEEDTVSYGYDVEFSLMLGGCFFLLLCVACVIEGWLDARRGKR